MASFASVLDADTVQAIRAYVISQATAALASQTPHLVAVDLADGHVRWTAEGAPDAWSYLSLDGRLLSVGERSIALLQ